MLAFYFEQVEAPGDRILFKGIYDRHRGKMYRVAKEILGSSELADEAVHDAFLQVIYHFSQFLALDESAQWGWILVVTRNTALNILKKERRSFPVGDNHLFDGIAAEQGEETTELVAAINALPEKYRDVLELYYLYGYRAKEIAVLRDITCDNALQRLSRARKLLMKKLQEED